MQVDGACWCSIPSTRPLKSLAGHKTKTQNSLAMGNPQRTFMNRCPFVSPENAEYHWQIQWSLHDHFHDYLSSLLCFFHFDFTVTFTSVKVPTKACVFPENKLVALQHRREASPKKKKKVAKKVGLQKISQYDGVESLWCSRHTGYYGIAIKSIIYWLVVWNIWLIFPLILGF